MEARLRQRLPLARFGDADVDEIDNTDFKSVRVPRESDRIQDGQTLLTTRGKVDAPDKNPRIDTEPRTQRSGVRGSASRGFIRLGAAHK